MCKKGGVDVRKSNILFFIEDSEEAKINTVKKILDTLDPKIRKIVVGSYCDMCGSDVLECWCRSFDDEIRFYYY